jgi:Na+:H+ antiporter, NhaA family
MPAMHVRPHEPAPVVLVRKLVSPLRNFLKTRAKGGVLLVAAAITALLWANSPWGEAYEHMLHAEMSLTIAGHSFSMHILHWIDDALMAVFFFTVGLEIKREVLAGELSSPRQAALPIAAAIGGCVVPALIYVAINLGEPTLRGWAVPMATDIAFALGVLTLLGSRVPLWLVVFLTALAIVDDLIAVVVIALFYTASIDFGALGAAALITLFVVGMNVRDVRSPLAYLAVGTLLWFAMFQSGIHATIAGVIMGLSIPASPRKDRLRFVDDITHALEHFKAAKSMNHTPVNRRQQEALHGIRRAVIDVDSPSHRLEHALHPIVSYAILPVFAIANAGVAVPLSHVVDAVSRPGGLGVGLGLVLGKPIGIVLASWLAVRSGAAEMPKGGKWSYLVGASILGGIGFTMSLFVTGLAFDDPSHIADAKVGILLGSVIAAGVGVTVLHRVLPLTSSPDRA